MEESSSREGIPMLVYDVDLTLTLHHTQGLPQRLSFEKPYWRNNLRCIDRARIHMAKMKQHAKICLGTFNTNTTRIESYRSELWLHPPDCAFHAEFVDKKKYPQQGKNKHIAELLLNHYQQENAPKITKVILIDDDHKNIVNLCYYNAYVCEHYPNHPELQVQVIGHRMSPPTLISPKNINAQVSEAFYSEFAFVSTLTMIEHIILPQQELQTDLRSSTESLDSEEANLRPWPLASVFDMTHMRKRLTSSLDGRKENINPTPKPKTKLDENRGSLIKSH